MGDEKHFPEGLESREGLVINRMIMIAMGLLHNILKDQKGEPERGGSEWEPIKILLKNSAYEPKTTRRPPCTSLAKST
jgi:hypothetical protein